MSARKCGWLFLSMLIFEFAVSGLLIIFSDSVSMNIMQSLLLSQFVILFPACLFLAFSGEKLGSFIAFGRPKLTTSILVIVLTYLFMPLIITVNAISMLFVDNEVAALQGYLTDVPAWQVLLMVGIIGPVSEEFVFRGVLYHGLKRSGRAMGAVLVSALLFGLTHMNFNQMSYAVVVGVISALLLEGSGSIVYSMLMHICINTTNALQIVFMDPSAMVSQEESRRLVEETMHMPYKEALSVAISVMGVFATLTGAIAVCLFWAIVKKENRTAQIRAIFIRSQDTLEKRGRLFSLPLVIGIMLCLMYMIADVCLKRL